MKTLIIKVIKRNGEVVVKDFQVEDYEDTTDYLITLYHKYIKSYLESFESGDILDWEVRWGN